MNLKEFVENVRRIDARCQAAYRQNNDIDAFYALESKLEVEMDQMCNCNLYDHYESIDENILNILKAWDQWDDILEEKRNEYLK